MPLFYESPESSLKSLTIKGVIVMAQVTKKTKKDGTTSYLIRAYSGRTQAGKVITKCKTVTLPPG